MDPQSVHALANKIMRRRRYDLASNNEMVTNSFSAKIKIARALNKLKIIFEILDCIPDYSDEKKKLIYNF